MKAVSARWLAYYNNELYQRAKIQKWISVNFKVLDELERNSAFMAEFVSAVNKRLNTASTAASVSYYSELHEEMTAALCQIN